MTAIETKVTHKIIAEDGSVWGYRLENGTIMAEPDLVQNVLEGNLLVRNGNVNSRSGRMKPFKKLPRVPYDVLVSLQPKE